MSMFGMRLRHNSLRILRILLTSATGMAGVAAFSFTLPLTSVVATAGEPTAGRAVRSERTMLPSAESLSDRFRSAAQKVLPSVVEIKAAQPKAVPFRGHSEQRHFEAAPFAEFLTEDGFSADEKASEQALGCGVIIDPSGIVLTNCHVVEEVVNMLVELPDGRLYKVKDVRKDKRTDLAVLSVDCTERLPAARLGDSENMLIGDWVLSIGSPFELEQTVSAGIISATGRSVRGAAKTRLLQTDAAINPGSSGGALVNLRGEVVGITTAIASRDGGYQGVGFAVPINLAKWVSADLREHGRVRRGYIGVTTTKASNRTTGRAAALRVGVRVTGVAEDSPAHNAGVRENDVIVSFDSRPIRTSSELDEIVEQVAVGSKHQLEVLRAGTPKSLEVTVEQASTRPQALSPEYSDADSPLELVYSRDLELAVSDSSQRSGGQLGMKTAEGVLVVQVVPGGAAFRAGVRKGMVIVHVGNFPVRNTDDFAEIMDDESLEKGIELHVSIGGSTRKIRVGQLR